MMGHPVHLPTKSDKLPNEHFFQTTSFHASLSSGATTFVIAYAVHKAFAPVRISATLACAPLIVRYLRRKGVLKVKK